MPKAESKDAEVEQDPGPLNNRAAALGLPGKWPHAGCAERWPPDDQQECRRSHCEHYERPEMMVYGLSLQWTLFFHIEGYAMPETAVNVASRNNIQQLSRTSMTWNQFSAKRNREKERFIFCEWRRAHVVIYAGRDRVDEGTNGITKGDAIFGFQERFGSGAAIR